MEAPALHSGPKSPVQHGGWSEPKLPGPVAYQLREPRTRQLRAGVPARSGSWRLRFNSDWNGYSADFGNHFSYDTTAQGEARDALPANGNIGVGPYSVIILSQDAA